MERVQTTVSLKDTPTKIGLKRISSGRAISIVLVLILVRKLGFLFPC